MKKILIFFTVVISLIFVTGILLRPIMTPELAQKLAEGVKGGLALSFIVWLIYSLRRKIKK